MLRVLTVELRKLNRSLAAALAISAPGLIAVFTFFNTLRVETAQPWDMWMISATGIWAFFMLPMSATALTALIAHMEHGPRAWDHLRALPLPRWTLYAAKAVSVHTQAQTIITPTGSRVSSNAVTTALVAATVVMAVVAIGLFVVAAVNGLF